MKYSEWNLNQKTLFAELESLHETGIFNVLGSEQLHFFFLIKFGNKEVVSSLEKVSNVAVAQMLNNLYYAKWQKLADIYLNELEVGFASSTTTENMNTDKSTKKINADKTSQVSAYNDDEFSNVSGDIDITNESGERETSTSTTTTVLNLKSVDFQRALLENSNITNVICEDISKLVLLSIY